MMDYRLLPNEIEEQWRASDVVEFLAYQRLLSKAQKK